MTTTATNTHLASDISPGELSPVPFARSKASVALDAIRGIAALLVCLGHWRRVLFVPFRDVISHRALMAVAYLITGAGDQAVIVFFVLSGFLVGGTILRALDQQHWSWKQYLTHRLVRLWLVLLPALTLGALWDHMALALRANMPGYGGEVLQHIYPSSAIAQALTAPVFLGNAAFLQRILVPELGTNGPLWSLANEFWYYLLFPCALFTLSRYYRPLARTLFGVSFLLIALFVGGKIMLFFPIWLAGALLLVIPRRNLRPTARIAATAVYIAIFFGCAAGARGHTGLTNAILTLTTTAFFWVLLSATERSSDGPAERLSRESASFSYTLYLVNMPFLYLLAGFVVHDTPWLPTLRNNVVALTLLLVVILYAWLVARATEFNLIPVRRRVEARLSRRPIP